MMNFYWKGRHTCLGGFRPEIIHEKGNRSILYDKFLRSLLEPEIFRFVSQSIYVILCGICNTGFEFDIAEIGHYL